MLPRISFLFSLLLFCCVTVLMVGSAPAQTGSAESDVSSIGAGKHLGTLPPAFRRNVGQWSSQILYSADARGAAARFTRQGVSFAYTRGDAGGKEADRPMASDDAIEENEEVLVWNVTFDGANPTARIVGENEHPGVTSYLLGSDPSQHHSNVPESERIWYRDLYPKIDLRYGDADGALKYDYIVRPGGGVSSIRMRCDGIERLRVNEAGELEIETAWGVVREGAPVAWQEIDGVRQMVDVRYAIVNDTTFGFSIHAGYRPEHELVIDPVILGWSTFVGGGNGGDGYLLDIALDTAGNVYGSGHYNSGFPTTPGVYQRTNKGDADIFVFKLDRSGARLLYATFIGGRDNDSATGIAVTPAGEAIICGTTHSDNFPTTSGAFASQRRGNSDLVLAKLNASGSALVFSTYMGGRSDESRARLALDSSGDIYLGGTTESIDFPTTAGAYDASYGGGDDAVVARFSPDGKVCRFATFLGSRGSDTLTSIAVDADGDVVAVGTTNSSGFPVTSGVIDRTGIASGTSGWLTRIAPDGGSVLTSTLLRAHPRRVVVDPTGDVIVAGDLPSEIRTGGFAATPGVFGAAYGGGGDAVVMRLNHDFSTLGFAAYLGGTGEETVTGLALAPDGDILVGGSVYHSLGDLQRSGFTPTFPLTSCALDKTHTYDSRNYFQGQYEGFFSRISGDGTRLHYSTLLGGRSHDYKVNVAVPNSPAQEVVISLTTHSSDFPTTAGAYQRSKLNDNEDQPVVLVLKPTVTALFDSDTTGCGSVAFTDRSFGNCLWHDTAWTPTSWRWEFGDGTTSTDQSPVHEYLKPGSYKVKLVTGDLTDSITKMVEVRSARGDAFVRLHVDRTHQAVLGSDVTIPVILDDDPDTLRSTSIAITFRYDTTMMAPIPFDAEQLVRLVEDTPIEGWDLRVQQPESGVLLIRAISPDGEVLHGPDTLLRLDFTTFLRAGVTTLDDSIWTTELQVDATLDGRYCTRLETTPGQLTLGICGLQYRLIEMADFGNKLDAAQPNPFNPTTEIPFSLAFDGPAVLEVFTASGERVAVLVDGVMTAGDYVVRWDATEYPSGVYYYRLRSGRWSQTRRMVVVK